MIVDFNTKTYHMIYDIIHVLKSDFGNELKISKPDIYYKLYDFFDNININNINVLEKWYISLLNTTIYPCSCGSNIRLNYLVKHARTGINRHNRAKENQLFQSSKKYINNLFSKDIIFIINSYVYQYIIINYDNTITKK